MSLQALQALGAQLVNGLASASILFLVASGLSLIFGVTRIVNFAHGSFAMLGLYLAYTLVERLGGLLGYWGALLLAPLVVAALGALVEVLLLRRLYRADEHELHEELIGADDEPAVAARISLDRLLGLLPPAQERVIALVKIEGLSIAEASELTWQSESLVKVNIHRGLKKLAAIIEKE